MIIECYDVGGTKIKGALIREGKPYSILESVHLKSKKGSVSDLVLQIKKASHYLHKRIKPKKIDALAIGLPGPVEEGLLKSAPPLHINKTVDIERYFHHVQAPVFIENDLNMAVMAELYFGIGRETKDFCLLTLSTGIGTGMVINSKPLAGAYGEFGHDVLERDSFWANVCSCGNNGCWAAQASGYGIELMLKAHGLDLSGEQFFSRNNKNSAFAQTLIARIRDYNAHGIGNILNAFPAKSIAIMGSLGIAQFDRIIPSKEEIRRYTVNSIPEIKITGLGQDIGIIGDYAYALNKLRGQKK